MLNFEKITFFKLVAHTQVIKVTITYSKIRDSAGSFNTRHVDRHMNVEDSWTERVFTVTKDKKNCPAAPIT